MVGGSQKLGGDGFKELSGHLQGIFHTGYLQCSHIFLTRSDKGVDLLPAALFTNERGHIEREEVGHSYIFCHSGKVDMIGIHKIVAFIVQCLHGFISLLACIGRHTAYIDMFTVGFIPYGTDIHPFFIRSHDRSQLRCSLMSETIAHSDTLFS